MRAGQQERTRVIMRAGETGAIGQRMRFLVKWILAPSDLIRVAINQSIPQALEFCWYEKCHWPSGETRATFITSCKSRWRWRMEVWAQTALLFVLLFFFVGAQTDILEFLVWHNIKLSLRSYIKYMHSSSQQIIILLLLLWYYIRVSVISPGRDTFPEGTGSTSGFFFISCGYFCIICITVASLKWKCSCFYYWVKFLLYWIILHNLFMQHFQILKFWDSKSTVFIKIKFISMCD